MDNWASTYVQKQPIEDVREYFGESIALFFVFVGYLVTQLWILAGIGLFTFTVAMIAFSETGSTQNPYIPLFAIYVAVWSINFAAGWRRLEKVYQVRCAFDADIECLYVWRHGTVCVQRLLS